MCHIIYVYRANPDSPLDQQQQDPAYVIKEALPKALVHYYPLAGKLKRDNDGKLRINCNADGVPFLEAKANCELSSIQYLDRVDIETAKCSVFDFPAEDEYGQHPLALKVTKFLCGGFTIGLSLLHSVFDGFGAAQFIQALAEFASGKSEPSVKPVWEREKLMGTINKEPIQFPANKALLSVSPFCPNTELLYESFNLDGESIRRLKMNLSKENDDADDNMKESFTTLESLGAYVWRSRARALDLNPDGKTLFSIAVGLRQVMDPPLPSGYYGNAFVPANGVLTVKELNEKPLSEVVKLIKQSKNLALNADYIKHSINMLEFTNQGDLMIEGYVVSSLAITDWRPSGFLELDFGWEPAANIYPVPWILCGNADVWFFLPLNELDPSMKGGVRVFVALPKAAMPKFREEMESLKII